MVYTYLHSCSGMFVIIIVIVFGVIVDIDTWLIAIIIAVISSTTLRNRFTIAVTKEENNRIF